MSSKKKKVMSFEDRFDGSPLSRVRIITVFNQKGGCGKTMVTMQLAASIAQLGYRTLVVDMDPQNTSVKWAGAASEDNPFPATVIGMQSIGNGLVNEIRKLSANYDFVLFDSPPALGERSPWAALNLANLGIVPVMPGADNLWALDAAIKMDAMTKDFNPELISRFLINAYQPNQKVSIATADLVKEIAQNNGMKVFKTIIPRQTVFQQKQIEGSAVLGLTSKEEERSVSAEKAIKSLREEVFELLFPEDNQQALSAD